MVFGLFKKSDPVSSAESAAQKKATAQHKLHKPLFDASTRDELVRALRDGADLNYKNEEGQTPLFVACSETKYHTHEYNYMKLSCEYYRALDLLTLKADPNIACGPNKETALHAVILNFEKLTYKNDERKFFDGAAGLVRALIRVGADVNAKDAQGRTPADIARQLGFEPSDFDLDVTIAGPKPELKERNDWIKLNDAEVAHIQCSAETGYKVTEMFNFSTKSYKCIT
jgi:hypothetical protein